MTKEEILAMEAGPEMDALVAEKIMGWKRVQPPKWDYDGPLPDQGEVLASPCLIELINNGEYKWPPKGVIPFTFFINKRYSTDMAAAWEVVEKFTANGEFARIERGTTGGLGCPVIPHWEVGLSKDGYCYWSKAPTAPLAICRAALLAKLNN